MAGAWPVYSDGEGKEVEVLDEEPDPEGMEEFGVESCVGSPRLDGVVRAAEAVETTDAEAEGLMVSAVEESWGTCTPQRRPTRTPISVE